MNSLKKIFIISIFCIFQNAFGCICVNATSNYKMFGSVLRSDILKNPFVMAFQDEHFENYKIFSSDNDAQLVSQVHNMTKGQCSIILGLFTSQDCLVSGPILKENNTIGLSSSCSDNHIINYYPYIYTAVPKLSSFSEMVANYINNKDTSIVYAFYQPADVYSNSGFSAFIKFVKKPVITIPVSSSGNFDIRLFKRDEKQESTIVFFTYPLPSAQILVSLDSYHLITNRTNIIGASSWIFDVSVFKPIKSILIKAKTVNTPSLVDQKQINSSKFYNNFIKLYKRPPDVVEVLTYDMTRLAVQCYRITFKSGNYDNKLFVRCIRNNKYNGVSGHTKFQKNSSFSVRKIYLIDFAIRIQ